MIFVELSELYSLIASSCVGYNETSAIDELRRAARLFCRETLISQETQETSFAEGDTTLSYDSPDSRQVDVVRVMSVTCPRGPLKIVTLAELDNRFANWRSAPTGSPCFAANESPSDRELALYPGAGAAETPVHVRIAVMPTRIATKLDKTVLDEYGEVIGDGALARILRIPGKAWTDKVEADKASGRFEMELSRTRAASNKNRSVASISTAIPRYA